MHIHISYRRNITFITQKFSSIPSGNLYNSLAMQQINNFLAMGLNSDFIT